MSNQSKGGLSKVGDILNKYKLDDKDKFVSREFQKYAYDLAVELNDLVHKSLYMKLAKSYPRAILEKARSFVADAQHAKSKAKLFMWKVSELKKKQSES